MREHSLVELHYLAHLHVVKAVEGHDWVLSHKVAERDKALILIVHKEEQDCSDIRHALDVANIRSIHGEGLQDALQLHVVGAALLE